MISAIVFIWYFREPLLELKPCIHPTVMKDMCAECGADLRKDDMLMTTASVPMVHSIPELKVSEEVSHSKACFRAQIKKFEVLYGFLIDNHVLLCFEM